MLKSRSVRDFISRCGDQVDPLMGVKLFRGIPRKGPNSRTVPPALRFSCLSFFFLIVKKKLTCPLGYNKLGQIFSLT